MNIDSITFSPNCKKITVVVSDCVNNITISYNNLITNATYFTGNLTPNGDDIVVWEEYVTVLEPTVSAINGVINISATDVSDSSSQEFSSAVASCELYCCVAKLVEEGINCTCNCSKCDDDIKTAEKVHLLIKSAEASANQGKDTDAVDKYNKAKNYCTSTCGCGC